MGGPETATHPVIADITRDSAAGRLDQAWCESRLRGGEAHGFDKQITVLMKPYRRFSWAH